MTRGAAIRAAVVLAVVILIVGLVDFYSSGALLRPSNLINVLRQITYNAILAIGQTFVIITAGIDLSVGSLISLCGVVMALFVNAVPWNGFALIVATLAVGCCVGALAGLINALPVVRLNLPPFITTLAMMQMARGLSYTLSHGQPISLRTNAFDGIGIGFIPATAVPAVGFPGVPVAVVWMFAVAVFCAVLLGRTRFGRYVYAIGGNEEAARLAGVNVAAVKIGVYVISGVSAAIVGLLLLARFSSGSPQTGTGYELQAIAAAVVGGTSLMGGRGTILGTFLGALLIGLLYNAMDLLHIESYTQLIVLGGVILLAVIADEVRKRYLK